MFLFGKTAQYATICSDIVNLTEDGVLVINHKQEIILFNHGAERIFGYADHEVIGKGLNFLLPNRFHQSHYTHIEDFKKSDAVTRQMAQRSRQIYGRAKDGHEFVASVQIIKLNGQGGAAYAAVVRDISKTRQTEEELLRLAATDPLTGAFNRREFTARAEREAVRSRRYRRPLSLLMLDIDHFKKLNDTYGHAAGDKALQRFVTLCCNTLRNVDIFGRWGGEEFVALLPETDLDTATVIADRLRETVAKNVLSFEGNNIQFTVSAGVTQYLENEVSIEMPLSRADAAVYKAKNEGRNRVIVLRN